MTTSRKSLSKTVLVSNPCDIVDLSARSKSAVNNFCTLSIVSFEIPLRRHF
jgi:hypothetical protein